VGINSGIPGIKVHTDLMLHNSKRVESSFGTRLWQHDFHVALFLDL